MPGVEVDGLTINYEVQGEDEPLLLIPYSSADHACSCVRRIRYRVRTRLARERTRSRHPSSAADAVTHTTTWKP